jgi:hypothetical protein
MIPGFYDISAGSYHGDPCLQPSLSNSIAQILLDRSPRHAWLAHPRLNRDFKPDNDKRSDLGTAAHDALLEGGTAKICVIKPEDYRSKPTKSDSDGAVPKGWTNNAIRAARDEAYSNGLVPILPWDNERLRQMVETAQRFLGGSEVAKEWVSGESEKTVVWLESNGVWCRSRIDRLSSHFLFDYKTCESAEPEYFGRHLSSMSYDFQIAFYQRGVRAVTGKDLSGLILAQEIDPPYACTLHGLSEQARQIAEDRVEQAIKLWGDCLRKNEWPSYSNRIHYQEPPPWKVREYEARVMERQIEDGSWQT